MSDARLSRVEELYHAALSRPVDEREAFLDRECDGDEGLLRDVRSLLALRSDADGLLEQPVAEAATARVAVVRGTRLGPYEVGDLVGAGGMGEVYRARDTRLGRDVAVKVLPDHVARDTEALARFDREARAVAALSHPHVAAVFDIGNADGTHYLVMELLEGETLAERLKRGPLAEKEALRIGAEVAEALGAAHGRGVVHRDVKPGNVMLTRAGAKLLDFGLARRQRTTGTSGETVPATTGMAPGVIAGTLPYMPPEQLEGRPADARADVWALGCVLFEMRTGERAFDGDSPAALIAAIEKDEAPSAASRRPGTSAVLDRLVRQCLRKDPAERWQSAQDVALRLREIAEAEEASGSGAAQRAGVPLRRAIPAMAGLAVAALLAGALLGRLGPRPRDAIDSPAVVRSQIDLTAERPLLAYGRANHPVRRELAVSRDGRLLAWAAASDETAEGSALFVRQLATGEVTRLEGTEGASQPFFSPDGRWIGFFAREAASPPGQWWHLRKVPAEGGLAVELAPLPFNPKGAWWGADGRIILGSISNVGETEVGLRSLPDGGGPLEVITSVDPSHEAEHQLPVVLPGERTLLFTSLPSAWSMRARVEAVSLIDGSRKRLVDDAGDARYLTTGHLVFARRGALLAAPFDPRRLELTGPAVPVVDAVSQALGHPGGHTGTAAAQFAVSDAGLLVYAPGGLYPESPTELLLLDEAGVAEPLPGFDKPLVSPQMRYSPDGRRLAFIEQYRSGLVWLFDVDRQTFRPLSRDGVAGSPVWSPEGDRLAVGWSEAGPLKLWIVPVQGGEWERLTEGPGLDFPQSWSPDGRFLAFQRSVTGEGNRVLIYRFEDRQVVPFPTDANAPAFSPDGRWLAFAATWSGQPEVYITSFPGQEQTLTVSRGGGDAPAWSRDGGTLYYYSRPSPVGDGRSMMAVSLRPGPEPSLGAPRTLFRLPDGFVSLFVRTYDLHPDGRRFVVGRWLETEPEPPITRLEVVHNWHQELLERVPIP